MLLNGSSRLSVSVIIPTYNRAAFVAQAIESALAQTRRPDEIIVVDDGSTDETDRVLSAFGSPVTVVRQPNRGRSAARNAALRAAKTDAVLFLDSDDWLMPSCVERCVQELESRPEVGVVYSDTYLCNAAGEPIGLYSQVLPGNRPSGQVLGELARRNFLTVTSMIRRSCLEGITFEQGLEYFEDYDVWRRLAVRCEFQYVDEPLLRYRLHEAMTSTRVPQMLASEVEVQRRILAMSEFAALPGGEQAGAFCVHGCKQAVLGDIGGARLAFLKSIRTLPTYAGAYPLLFLSLLGKRVLQFAILQRRKWSGNRLGTEAGLTGILKKPVAAALAASPTNGSRPAKSTSPKGDSKIKVLVVGQTPPPHHGQAIMIERLVKSNMAGVELIHVRMGMSTHLNEIGHVRFSKIIHLFVVIARIIYRRFVDGVRILYYPPGGPDRVPMFRDFIILLSTRWLFDKTVFHFHAGGVSELYDQLNFWQRWTFRRAYFGADAAVRLSELNPEDGRKLIAKRDYVIPYGIEDPCPEFSVSTKPILASSHDPLQILFVGALRESKGVMVLIDACAELASRGVSFQLELMGQWQCEEFANQVKHRICESNLDGQVHFLGVLTGEKKAAAFRRADTFCFPSFFNCETFGVVLLEAAAFGLSAVATRWRGIPSIVHDGKTGFLVEPHDAAAVADRLALLASDPALRARLGTAARKKFERQYTLERHLERMRAVFLGVASDAPMNSQSRPQPSWQPHRAEAVPRALAALAPVAHTSSSHEHSGV
jgi:glycosyltransferase involved in cell wall biosynthesis/CTP:molybdopterin cytidylyltransferase MocA